MPYPRRLGLLAAAVVLALLALAAAAGAVGEVPVADPWSFDVTGATTATLVGRVNPRVGDDRADRVGAQQQRLLHHPGRERHARGPAPGPAR